MILLSVRWEDGFGWFWQWSDSQFEAWIVIRQALIGVIQHHALFDL
jgi:hypothetical protein